MSSNQQHVHSKTKRLLEPATLQVAVLNSSLQRRVHLQQQLIVVASSGIAALILHGARTAHSTFKMPVPVNSESTCNIPFTNDVAVRIRNASVILWDVAPMMHRHVFEAVNRTLRDVLMNQDSPFDGKIVIFGSDFRQVYPVVVRGTQAQIENASLKKSTFWNSVETLKLTENMRVLQTPQNEPFIQFLLQVGEGRVPTVRKGTHSDYIRIPQEHIFQPVNPTEQNPPIEQLIRHIYPNLENAPLLPQDLMERAILTPLNANVNKINDLATQMLHGACS